jgi:hypothetical protein
VGVASASAAASRLASSRQCCWGSAHQLRRGGYLLEQNAPLIAQVRSAAGVAPLTSTLRDWHARLSARSRAMLTGAAALDACLDCRPAPPGDGPSDDATASPTTDPIRPPSD